jgi:hypothetical protein
MVSAVLLSRSLCEFRVGRTTLACPLPLALTLPLYIGGILHVFEVALALTSVHLVGVLMAISTIPFPLAPLTTGLPAGLLCLTGFQVKLRTLVYGADPLIPAF